MIIKIKNKDDLKEVIKTTFQNNLKEIMIKEKVPEKVLAKELKISTQAISNYLTGKALPTIDNLFLLSFYFKCPINYFFP